MSPEWIKVRNRCSAVMSSEACGCGGADLLQLVGLQDLRDRHRETQSLTQISVLLLQSHQRAAEQVLVHLADRDTKPLVIPHQRALHYNTDTYTWKRVNY